ncbi:hypothetical protein B0H15DRAFT_391550 [Mycena belliarum]|uniref:C2H2-type domain-containing protein n=1 Tax=Mycena belliarum TaxID=1033014 RepID=A0AAD6XNX4_9AGAR|nr:hypothetical protein B0H15DRAFT_391550 [Mycena belliae]
MYHPAYRTVAAHDDRPTLPSIGRIFDGAPAPAAYRRPSLTLPPLDNGAGWRMSSVQMAADSQARAFPSYQSPAMREQDIYRMPNYMMPHGRLSPESDPGRDGLSSASSYSSASSPYDTHVPYRPSSAPHLGAYRSAATYHHSAPSNPFYPPRPPSSAARHQCSYCNKRFNRPSGLKIHLTTHTGDKPFVCPEESCGRSFSVRSNMRRHVRIVHQLAREGSGEPRAASES